ncbi:hypothetical protein [Aurantibacillus circumpalustris]|uniref:hypothetical protein n=1 Tax=Aurantibacillus circumpalustris TaxID=3036359 RepID=UPI00295BA25C|nr:hypothetical protein [Aurantibacillus circumpalustris]
MKFFCYTVCFIIATFFFGACGKSDLYEEKEKKLDSLSGAVNSIVKELQKTDTLVLQKSITRYTWYKQFVEQNVNDTVRKEEADNLQHFYSSGKNLESFSTNRKMVLKRAVLISSQLAKLSQDVKSKSITQQQLQTYSEYEINEASKLIESAYTQQKLFHSGLEEFKSALKGVEMLIRSRNKGELPTIIKDTVSF